MRLFSFENSEYESFNNSKAKDVFKCKLYYVSYGRNAWHSTWVTKYREGSISTSLKSARDFVEYERIQGSVFYISEIPAIAYKSSRGFLFVTEINTSQLLKGYNPFSSERDTLLGEPKLESSNSLNQKFKNLASTYSPYSYNWFGRTRYENSVLILGSTEKEIELESYNKRKNFRYRSYSNGSLVPFSYSKEKNNLEDKYIDEIVKNCNKSGSKNSNRISLYKCLNSKTNKLSEDILMEQAIQFYNSIKKIKSPSKGKVWINDCDDNLESKDFDDINKFLNRNGLNAIKKDFDLNDFLPKPYKNVILNIYYPLSALNLLLEANQFEASNFFEHLKMIIIRLKSKSKIHNKIILSFYDEFLNSRVFIFSLNYFKEKLFYDLEQLHKTLSNSFEINEYEGLKKDDYSVQIYNNSVWGFSLQKQKSFIDLFEIKPKAVEHDT